jgi:hypothetical protein
MHVCLNKNKNIPSGMFYRINSTAIFAIIAISSRYKNILPEGLLSLGYHTREGVHASFKRKK